MAQPEGADNSDVLRYVRAHPGCTAEQIDNDLGITDSAVRMRTMLRPEVDADVRAGVTAYIAKPWREPSPAQVEDVYHQIKRKPGCTDRDLFLNPPILVWEALDSLTKGDDPRVAKQWDKRKGVWTFTAIEEHSANR